MITVEPLTPAWESAFLASRNSVFTAVTGEYLQRTKIQDGAMPVRTFICRDETRVLSWGSFYIRDLELGRPGTRPLRLGHACAIGTLPASQRQGLARKVWQLAEKSLAAECDGIAIYTHECGEGYSFYRAQGYLPIAFPRQLRLPPSQTAPTAAGAVRTIVFPESQHLDEACAQVFRQCHGSHAGFMSRRPSTLRAWSDVSFFYDPLIIGDAPKLSWLCGSDGKMIGYCLWVAPMREPDWKHGTAEIWELAVVSTATAGDIQQLLQPAIDAAGTSAPLDWWSPEDHPLTEALRASGFEELPRGFTVLAKLFGPAKILGQQAQREAIQRPGGRVDLPGENYTVEIERDAATRLILGRSDILEEQASRLLTVHPSPCTQSATDTLQASFQKTPWAYLASEYI